MVVICIESDRGSVRRPANRLGGELSRELLTGVLYSQPITVNEVGHLARWLDCAHKYTSFTMKQKEGMEGGEITSEFEYSRRSADLHSYLSYITYHILICICMPESPSSTQRSKLTAVSNSETHA